MFRDQAILLTGASQGIGAALALELAKGGAHLALTARSKGALDEVARQCEALGGSAFSIAADVGKRADCERMVDEAAQKLGKLDVVIHNAGIGMFSRFDALADPAVVEDVMRVNYFGPMYSTFRALPHLKQSKGLLVAVASVAALTGVPTRSGYSASKHAMTGFFESLRIELKNDGVGVCIVYPGFVTTGIREKAVGNVKGSRAKGNQREISAEECAQGIVKAMAARKRDVFIPTRNAVMRWAKLVAPSALDRVAASFVRE